MGETNNVLEWGLEARLPNPRFSTTDICLLTLITRCFSTVDNADISS
jgi:hypothetical protein